MNAILFAIVTWVLTQLLFVWLCARLAAVRDLDMKDHLELRAYLVRAGLDADACDPSALPTIAAPTNAAAPRPELFERDRSSCWSRSENPGVLLPRRDRSHAAAPSFRSRGVQRSRAEGHGLSGTHIGS
jgi:hypothetical protein